MMTMIDQVANQNHLQLIKAMLPYLPPENQEKSLLLYQNDGTAEYLCFLPQPHLLCTVH